MKFLLPDKIILIFITLSVCFLAAVLIYAPEPRITYDSQAYIEASQSIDVYFNGKNEGGHTYLFRPPIIPIYLHFFQDKILAAKWLNAVCFVLSLWLCYYVGREFKFEYGFYLLFIISVCVSYPWLQNYFFVWSEPLFGTLLLLLIWMMLRDVSWVWITLMCVLLFFTRKAGLFVCAGVVLEYLFRKDYYKLIRISLTLGAIFAFWELSTFFYSGESTSQRLLLVHSGLTRWHWLDAITAWVFPHKVLLIVRVVIIGVFLVVFIKQLHELVLPEGLKVVVRVALSYVLIFAVFLGLPEYGEADRYLSVIIPLAMLLAIAILRALWLTRETKRYWLLFFLLWMTYPVGRTLYHLLL
jgi:hypothetical protein